MRGVKVIGRRKYEDVPRDIMTPDKPMVVFPAREPVLQLLVEAFTGGSSSGNKGV
jgi:hypothetical protein